MKAKYLSVVGLVGLVGLFGAGCASQIGNGKVEVRSEVAFWARTGGEAAILEDSKNRAAIAAAVAYLNAAERNGGPFTLSELREVIGRLKELQSKDAKLSILGGTAVLRRIAGGELELATPKLLGEAGLGLRDGLKAALTGP